MYIPKGGIAFFDSGIGGLTVLEAARKYLKNEILYYYGDNERAPYGNLSVSQIKEYVFTVFELFQALKVSAAVVACNTVTAVCIDELRRKFPFPIIGVEPAVLSAAKKGGNIFVLVTAATYQSLRFQSLCKEAAATYPNARIQAIACEKLAGSIEANVLDKNFDYTSLLPKARADSVVLGCTHYVYIEEQIKNYYQCPIYHGNDGIAKRIYEVVKENRDGRPPREIEEKNMGYLTTIFPSEAGLIEEENNTNKCSHENTFNPLKNLRKRGIYFLGKNAEKNEKIYKQTYVCDLWGFHGEKVVKNPKKIEKN